MTKEQPHFHNLIYANTTTMSHNHNHHIRHCQILIQQCRYSTSLPEHSHTIIKGNVFPQHTDALEHTKIYYCTWYAIIRTLFKNLTIFKLLSLVRPYTYYVRHSVPISYNTFSITSYFYLVDLLLSCCFLPPHSYTDHTRYTTYDISCF